MRIQKIEVVGFKSFADRQVVELDDHITGVIGPNGCGKSNIVDAMRWCLGEQRAKHLRGSGMADVIFSGCATRGAAACAQVTVSFSNDGRVPAAYLNFAEIAITRRLFRDGSSEYLINGVLCRLRDITELLMGTGVGTRGYSIIEQGRVSDIVVSKPQDRRAMLDEAAGITKFKLQKNTAEKRIQQTQQNLDRVQDLVTELQGRLGSLEKAAAKAKRYLALREELQDVELWLGGHRFLGLMAKHEIVARKVHKVSGQVSDLQSKLAEQIERVNTDKEEVSVKDQALHEAQERAFEVENRLQLSKQDQRFRQSSQEGHEDNLKGLADELAASQEAKARLEQELATHRSALEEVDAQTEGEGAADAVQGLDSTHQELALGLREAQSSQEQLRTALSDHAAKQADLSARLMGSAQAQERHESRIDELETELADLREQEAQESQSHEDAKAKAQAREEDLQTLKEQRRNREQERDSLRERLRELSRAESLAQTACTHTRSRLDSLREIQGRYRGCDSGVQVLMDASKAEDSDFSVQGIAADYLQVPPQWDRAVSACLQERLQALVLDEPDACARGIEFLVAKKEGRSVFLPQGLEGPTPASVPELGVPLLEVVQLAEHAPAGLANLLAQSYCVDSFEQALERWPQAMQAKVWLVTPRGDVFEPCGAIVGGSAESIDSALLEQKREITALAAELVTQEEAQAQASSQLVTCQTSLDEFERAQGQHEQSYVEAEKAALAAKQELARLQEATQRRDKDLARLQSSLDTAKSAQQEDLDQRAALEEELADHQEKAPELQDELSALSARIATLEAEREGVATQLTRAKVEKARRFEQRQALSSTLERAERALAQETAREEKLRGQIEAANSQHDENTQALDRLAQEEEELAQLRDESEEQKQACVEDLAAAKAKLESSEKDVLSLREEADGSKDVLNKAQAQLQDLESKKSALQDQIRERYQVDLQEVILDVHDRPLADKEVEQRAARLKKSVQGLGNVNLTAIEEHKEVQERFAYLDGQRSDLQDAIAQLQAAIDKINETTRVRFAETFEVVNEKFQAIFPRLFAGGKAQLVLTDPEDMLTTGVEIVAQPPGKRVSSLELMSGGEKALTAVSLIFGIFLIKPSPFCLLDEVDAPLDEANVGRFCDLVRELSADTQFIIITHNKRTMEAADRLYGVTMQQRGISKLVSVNMRKSLDRGRYRETETNATV